MIKNIYSYLLFKIFIFFIILVCFDFLFGTALNYLYYKQTSGPLFSTTYSIESTTSDILIFGASLAKHNYISSSFEKQLRLSCYNTGRDGISIFYNYAVLKGVLKRYSPKIILLDISRNYFKKSQESYDRLYSLLPYYKKHPEIHSIIHLKGPFEKFKLLSNAYPFNSMFFYMLFGVTNLDKKIRTEIKGYVPLKKVWNETLKKEKFQKYELDDNKVRFYELFIKDCLKSRVKLYIVTSPSFIKLDLTTKHNDISKKIAKKYNVEYIDLSQESIFLNDPTLFADPSHLNEQGSNIFTDILADKIIRHWKQS